MYLSVLHYTHSHTLSGCVIGPTFQFDVDEINFDVVSYGNFPLLPTPSFTLFTLSLFVIIIVMHFRFSVSSTGFID